MHRIKLIAFLTLGLFSACAVKPRTALDDAICRQLLKSQLAVSGQNPAHFTITLESSSVQITPDGGLVVYNSYRVHNNSKNLECDTTVALLIHARDAGATEQKYPSIDSEHIEI